MAVRAVAIVAVALVLAPAAAAGVDVVDAISLETASRTGAVGLSVPGAGPTVTRASALNTLLTGEVESSLLGGTPPGEPRLELGRPGEPRIRVVLPPESERPNERRYPIAVSGDGATGVLTSDSTRIDGLVSLSDVATGRLRWVEADDPVAVLSRLDDRIDRNERLRLPLTILALTLVYAVALVAPRLAPRVVLLALAANLWLAGWWLVALLAAAVALLPLGLACAATIATYLLVLGLDPEAVALSPFGPSQAGRFYGVSNLLETLLLLPALLGAALLGRAGIAVAAAALVTVGGNRFGADGGGLLVLLAGYAVLVLRLRGTRLTWARAAAVGAGVVALGLALVGVDAVLGGSSHVTDALGDGPGAVLGDLGDRLELSWRRSTASFGPAFVSAASLAVLALVATRRPRAAVTDALLAALAVSLLVNDTPSDVLAVGAAVAAALWRFETDQGAAVRSARLHWRPMRRSVTLLALLLAALALVAAGCGGEDTTATPETVEGTLPTETSGGNEDLPALDLTGDAAAGESIYASAGCGGCHTLAAAGSNGQVGPNLDDAAPSYELVVTRVTLGQGAMPSFKDQLSAQEIADVSQFVVDSAGG
jgi:mono/diheme cytochrome c family protein